MAIHMKRYFLSLWTLFLAAMPLRADDGMWLVTDPAAAGAQAVVSMDFIGTGSVISKDGLLITNHHVAYSDLAELNLLESGFCARTRAEELRIPGKKVEILQRMVDVTDEVEAVKDSLTAAGIRYGSRKLSAIMEKRYETPGLTVSFESMWAGSRDFIAYYKVYDDVRLVLAPPESVAAFGGDEDNWEWPQQKADFTLYRIYENGAPLDSPWHLKVAAGGVKEGDGTVVTGYPGRTHRYSSSFEMGHEIAVQWPLQTRLGARRMEILRKWMDADPEVRRLYADRFFSLSNAQEFYAGELACTKRDGVVARKQARERELAAWIAANPKRQAEWGTLLDDLRDAYASIAEAEAQKVLYRETLIRGTYIAPTLLRMHNAKEDPAAVYAAGAATVDPRVEKELLAFALKEYYSGIDPRYLGKGQRDIRDAFLGDWNACAEWMWDHPEAFADFLTEVKITAFPSTDVTDLRHCYTQAVYEMEISRGTHAYPDANSTLRLSSGKVCALTPRDAVRCSWFTTARGIFEKVDPSRYEFAVPEDFLAVLKDYDGPVDFITDNDITGGNSGSPVMNDRGELVGLAFDGNKESLSSDWCFVPEVTRCVCVDIRYILFILRNYYKSTDLLAEIGA